MTLNQDMQALHQYLEHWRLKLSMAKTTTTAFHLNNKDIQRHLDVSVNSAALPNNNHPAYLDVTLDHTLTYRQHIESLERKVNGRNGLLCCLAGSSWGACTATLRTGALTLVYSATEYISPVWCRSAHIPRLDSSFNNTMCIVNGCMCPTETTFLPVLAGIIPPDIRRESHVSNITKEAMENPDHILYQQVFLLPRFPGSVSGHTGLSLDTLPASSVLSLTCIRHGTIVSITVHLPSRPLALHPARHCHPVLTYRESSG